MPFLKSQDTIVALSTPQGAGAISIIRLSGSRAFEITAGIFKGKNPNDVKSHTVHFGYIFDHENNTVIDEVVVSIFKSPHSFTKENTVEISLHGSIFIQKKVLELCLSAGARLAAPGEFTQRAFFNGRFDLAQAEAVADLIASESASQHALALEQMKGGFSFQLEEMRTSLIDFAAMLELELDFAEEDVEFANRDALKNTISDILFKIQPLIDSFSFGNAIKKGVPIAIAGPPNVGKSTLLNVLLNDERAIVSDIPGTTRDTIEDTMVIDGILFRFIDTAGIRETEDFVESLGIKRSLKAIESAALVLIVSTHETSLEEMNELLQKIHQLKKPYIHIKNKSDIFTEKSSVMDEDIQISAKTNHGIAELKKMMLEKTQLHQTPLNYTISNIRHYEALSNTKTSLNKVLEMLNDQISTELVAEDLRDALHQLGSITGKILPDDILGSIFSKFCIGK